MKAIPPRREVAVFKRTPFSEGPKGHRVPVGVIREGTRMVRIISPERRDAVVKSALFNARVEGFRVPDRVVREARQMLRGKKTADELVQHYKRIHSRN